jgi:glycosyltransferase involved in cell wall biosynthesis
MEAMAAGLPVVASDLPGVRGLLRSDRGPDSELTLLSPPGDITAMAERVRSLLHRPALARELGEAARRHAFARFGRERMLERLFEIYRA